MAKGFKHGIAGTALNFRVLGRTEQPASPRENDIWIVTDTQIQSWVFSPEEPAEPSEGLLWIGVGSGEPSFNALKKNGILLAPVSAKLYSGDWIDVEAFLFRNGEWTQFSELVTDVYLLRGSDLCTAITGGWSARGWKNDEYCTAVAPRVAVGAESVTLSFSSSANFPSGVYETVSDVDLTKYSTMKIRILSLSGMTGGCSLCVFQSRSSTYPSKEAFLSFHNLNAGEYELDISQLTGSYCVGIYFHNITDATVEVDAIALRKGG